MYLLPMAMSDTTTPPFYHRFSLTMLGLSLLTAFIYVGQDIIVPLALAGLLAVLIRPLEVWLTRMGVGKVLSISLALLLAIVVISGITLFLSMQIADFTDDWPKLRHNLNEFYVRTRQWVRREYNVSYRDQARYLQKAQAQTVESLQGSDPLGTITGPLTTILLLPVYVFLLLYYRTMMLHFVECLFHTRHSSRVREILGEIKAIIQSYMVGLMLETLAVAVLNSTGLLILGVQFSILIGVLAAILNLIPYIGGIMAIGLTVLITFINQPDSGTILGVIGVFVVVQFIDNNFLVPVIIGSKVKINALVSIVGVLVGGALAGVSGMFLSIPAIAIMKVVFDRVEGLEAWGVLLGDQTPDEEGAKLFRLPRRRKKIA